MKHPGEADEPLNTGREMNRVKRKSTQQATWVQQAKSPRLRLARVGGSSATRCLFHHHRLSRLLLFSSFAEFLCIPHASDYLLEYCTTADPNLVANKTTDIEKRPLRILRVATAHEGSAGER